MVMPIWRQSLTNLIHTQQAEAEPESARQRSRSRLEHSAHAKPEMQQHVSVHCFAPHCLSLEEEVDVVEQLRDNHIRAGVHLLLQVSEVGGVRLRGREGAIMRVR